MVNSNHGTTNHYAMSRAIRAVVCVLVLLHRYVILFTAAKALFEVRLSKLFILMWVLLWLSKRTESILIFSKEGQSAKSRHLGLNQPSSEHFYGKIHLCNHSYS